MAYNSDILCKERTEGSERRGMGIVPNRIGRVEGETVGKVPNDAPSRERG